MEYRGVEYTVVQGVERGVWKWTASVTNLLIMGKAPTKSAAMAAVERAIDKALSPTKVRLERSGAFSQMRSVRGWFDMRDLGAVLDHEEPLPHPACDQAQ